MELKNWIPLRIQNKIQSFFNGAEDHSAPFYELLGKEEGIKTLVSDFYHIMETDHRAKDCLKVHSLGEDGKIPSIVHEKLIDFLTQWTGGPTLFQSKYGHPRMRQRHAHVKIGPKEKGQWLYCMNKALGKHPKALSMKQKRIFLNSCKALATRIQNRES